MKKIWKIHITTPNGLSAHTLLDCNIWTSFRNWLQSPQVCVWLSAWSCHWFPSSQHSLQDWNTKGYREKPTSPSIHQPSHVRAHTHACVLSWDCQRVEQQDLGDTQAREETGSGCWLPVISATLENVYLKSGDLLPHTAFSVLLELTLFPLETWKPEKQKNSSVHFLRFLTYPFSQAPPPPPPLGIPAAS